MRRKMTAPFLAVLALCGLLGTVRACAPSKNHVITVGSNTYVCVVINWKSYLVAVPKADEYSRIAIAGCKLASCFHAFLFTSCAQVSVEEFPWHPKKCVLNPLPPCLPCAADAEPRG